MRIYASPLLPFVAIAAFSSLAANSEVRSQDVKLTRADTMFVATLSSTEIVGRAGPPGASGNATINLRPMTNEVCYRVVIHGITATAAHIHKAPKGETGPVSVPFSTPRDTTSTGCTKVDAMVLTDIGVNPTNYYVNVHTAAFPGGAIRGQLAKPLAGGGG